MLRVLVLVVMAVSFVAEAKDPACAKQCDELLKSAQAQCRREEREPADHDHAGGGSCQLMVRNLRAQCLKKCDGDQRKRR